MSLQQRKKSNPNIDRISKLPDPVLRKILSYVPTKTAISTSILSTRWNKMFFLAAPIRLDLDDSVLVNPRQQSHSFYHSKYFSDFVDKVFRTHLSSDDVVESVKLYCKNYYANKLEFWFFCVMHFNAREFLFQAPVRNSNVFDLFVRLKEGKTLTRLELGKNFKVDSVPSDFNLPNLKVLVLFRLSFGINAFSRLIDGCPGLEELSFSNCNVAKNGDIRIHLSLLKKYTMKNNFVDESQWCVFELVAPKLEVLVYDDWLPSKYSLLKFKSLRTAHIDVGFPIQETRKLFDESHEDSPSYAVPVGRLIRACSSVVHLYLGSRSIYAIQDAPVYLPVFQNLTCLTVGCILRAEGWHMLADLLSNAPNLEKLRLEEGFCDYAKIYSDRNEEEGYESFESYVRNHPPCCLKHLKEIEFCLFNEENDEIKLIEYFLEHGKAIEKLELYCLPCKNSRTLDRLVRIPGQSKIVYQPR